MPNQLMNVKIALAAVLGAGLMVPALAAEPVQTKRAVLQCGESRIELRADCFAAGNTQACTRQELRFSASDSKLIAGHAFKAQPARKGDEQPLVEEKVGALSCVETKTQEKYVVAEMSKGGNCPKCEWHDVYSMDGALLGSTHTKKTDALKSALQAMRDKEVKRVTKSLPLDDFYTASAPASTPAPAPAAAAAAAPAPAAAAPAPAAAAVAAAATAKQ